MNFEKEDLLKLTRSKMPFGKYKDRILCDLPISYLEWFAQEGNKVLILLPPDTTSKYFKDGAIHPQIGLYYTCEILTKTENRFRIIHPQGDLRV